MITWCYYNVVVPKGLRIKSCLIKEKKYDKNTNNSRPT